MYLLVIRMAIFSLLSHALKKKKSSIILNFFPNCNCYIEYNVDYKGLHNLDNFGKLFDMHIIQFKGLDKAKSVQIEQI